MYLLWRFPLTVPKQMASCYIWSVSRLFCSIQCDSFIKFCYLWSTTSFKTPFKGKTRQFILFCSCSIHPPHPPVYKENGLPVWKRYLDICWRYSSFLGQIFSLLNIIHYFYGFFCQERKKMSRQQSKLKLLEVYICIHPRIGNVPSFPVPPKKKKHYLSWSAISTSNTTPSSFSLTVNFYSLRQDDVVVVSVYFWMHCCPPRLV